MKKTRTINRDNFRYKYLIISFFTLFTTGMLFGNVRIAGRLALSNIFQAIAFVLILPIVFNYLKMRDWVLYLSSIMFMLFGGIVSSMIFGVAPNIAQITFFLINILLIIFIFEFVQVEQSRDTLIRFYRFASIVLLVYFSIYAIYEMAVLHQGYIFLGFDDKSHAVIICGFLSFFVLRYFSGIRRYLFSVVFILLGVLTASKFAIVFAIGLVISIACTGRSFSHTIRRDNDGLGLLRFYFSMLIILGIVAISLYYVLTHLDSFYLFTRVHNGLSGQDESTQGHFLLIRYGLQAKMSNIGSFIFGIGPGSFSHVISSAKSGINLSQFSLADPTGYAAIQLGIMPMHSVLFSVFVEFPLPIFIAFVWLLYSVIVRLMKQKEYIMLVFFTVFIICTTFYSTHDELIYYFILFFMIIVTYSRPNQQAYEAIIA